MEPKTVIKDGRPQDYRERIYAHYTSARSDAPAPVTVAGFASRAGYLSTVVRKHFPSSLNAHVLDVGCGHGALLHFAALAGYKNLEGVDRSPQQVVAARRLAIDNIREADLLTALRETNDASRDAIVAFDVLEHFNRDELLPLIDETYRVLKPGGRFIIHVPNGASPFFGRVRYGDITHELAFTNVSLTQLLLASGFSSVECHEDKPHGRNPLINIVRRALWAAIRGALLAYIAAETGTLDRKAIFSQNFLAIAIKGK